MIFVGRTFCGARDTMDFTPTDIPNIKAIELQQGIFDELYVTRNITYPMTSVIQKEWDYNTILHALFDGNLHAGNIFYSADQVSCIRIKRRRKGEYQWMTMFEIPIETYADFTFDRYDGFARVGEYEYALVPVIENIEGNLNINSVQSSFEGMYLVDKSDVFGTILDVSISSTERVKPTSIVSTMGSKYPFVVSNGENNYSRLAVSALFMETTNDNYSWNLANGHSYRKRLVDFLSNGQPKIFKLEDGRCWMVQVVDNVIENPDGVAEKIQTAFSLVEIGSDESTNDLYFNNLIDVNVEGV